MDAISFVLGVQSRELRSSNMRELIYRPPNALLNNSPTDNKNEGPKLKASATLVYQHTVPMNKRHRGNEEEEEEDSSSESDDSHSDIDSDTENDSHSDDNEQKDSNTKLKSKSKSSSSSFTLTQGETYQFKRSISHTGNCTYSINSTICNFSEYETALNTIGVLTKARHNFLIFQGDVEAMARKSAKQLVSMLEDISGSAAYQQPYQQYERDLMEIDREVTLISSRTRGLKSERKMLKEQKEEAEKYRDKLKERQSLATEYVLWQLFHIHSDITDKQTESEDLTEELDLKSGEETEASNALKQSKKKASSARRAYAQTRKKCTVLQGKCDAMQPRRMEREETSKQLKHNIDNDEMLLQDAQQQKLDHENLLKKLEEEVTTAETDMAALETSYENSSSNSKQSMGTNTQLTPAQQKLLEKLQRDISVETAEYHTALQLLQKKLTQARARCSTLSNEQQDILKRLNTHKTNVHQYQQRADTAHTQLSTLKKEFQTQTQLLHKLKQRQQQAHTRKHQLDQKLHDIHNQLREAHDDRRVNKRQLQLRHSLEQLKRHFPGVRGRLVDLCRPSQRRYHLPVTVAGGKDLDAIVVDSRATARDCIQYLKDQRVGVATFLPLDGIVIPSQEETADVRRMCELYNGGGNSSTKYRLALDVIQILGEEQDSNHMKEIQKAVHYAVGNTVIAESLDAARALCFGNNNRESQRVKAVTVQGAVISKAGTMTGGTVQTGYHSSKKDTSKWDEQRVVELRLEKDRLEEERRDLDTVTLEEEDTAATDNPKSSSNNNNNKRHVSYSVKLDELESIIHTLTNRLEFMKSEELYSRNQLQQQSSLLKSSIRRKQSLETEEHHAENQIQQLEEEMTGKRQIIGETQQMMLDAFCTKHKFDSTISMEDLNRYQADVSTAKSEYLETRRKLQTHLVKLRAQMKYERQQHASALDKKCDQVQRRLQQSQEKLHKMDAAKDTLEDEWVQLQLALEDATSTMNTQKHMEVQSESDCGSALERFRQVQKEKRSLVKELSGVENSLERLRGRLHECLQKARVDEVHLPLLITAEGADDEEEVDPSNTQVQSQSQSQTLTQTTETPHYSQPTDRIVTKDAKDASKIDFSSLPKSLKQRHSSSASSSSGREDRKLKLQFETKLSQLTLELEGMSPNMKANEAALQDMRLEIKGVEQEFEELRRKQQKIRVKFHRLKRNRTVEFQKAFAHIDDALKVIYKDLTRSKKHPLGGNAYLSLDNADEPYLGGMKFNAMPPMKRFRDMEALSGGEKTVAALALLFAIHSYRPAPFFVMDEVDAALDNVNVMKVCNYIRRRSADFQCIVISLKDIFYERSHSLVGIAKDVATLSSRTFSLDLRRFAEDNEEEGDSEQYKQLDHEETVEDDTKLESGDKKRIRKNRGSGSNSKKARSEDDIVEEDVNEEN